MGNCIQPTQKTKPIKALEDSIKKSEEPTKIAKTSARSPRTKLRTLATSDLKGFKHSDSIDNFYEIQTHLGHGSFGEVVKAVHIISNQTRAIKIIDKKKIDNHQFLMQLLQQEFQVLQETDHPYLMRVYELIEDLGHYYIISEFLEGGELFDRILKFKRFSEKHAAKILQQVLLGLNYMHKRNIIHRDIKPENILLESHDVDHIIAKITDFGFAKCYDPLTFEGFDDVLGSPLYMAPEVVKKLKYDTKIDIWSLGIVAYIILSGKPPFSGKTKDELFVQLSTQSISYTGSVWHKISKGARSFVRKCLTRDPTIRSSAEDLLQHEWIKSMIEQPHLTQETLLEVNISLQTFRRSTKFQSGIIGFILSFNQRYDDMDRLRMVFNALDKSNDGLLTIDEIRDGLVTVMGKVKGNLLEFEEIMSSLDQDGNGVIDYSEFLAAAIDKHQLITTKNLRAAFSMLDTDKSGTLSKEELLQVFDTHSYKQKNEELLNNIMKEVDRNGNGQIDFEEFSEAMNRYVTMKYHGLSSIVGVIGLKFRKTLDQSIKKLSYALTNQQGW